MVLADKTLFVAGPPDVFANKEGDVAALEGKKGGCSASPQPQTTGDSASRNSARRRSSMA